MKTKLIPLLFLFASPLIATAAEPDIQLRIPFHLQYIPEWEMNRGETRLGLAAWALLPDAMAEKNSNANLLLIGPTLEFDNGNWLEFMVGGLQKDGDSDFLFDFRFKYNVHPRLCLTGELGYFPEKENRRLYTFLIVDTPIRLGSYTTRAGIESENIFFAGNKRDSLGIGPRITFPIPQKIAPSIATAFTLAYEFRNDRDFFRCYLTFTYRLGEKR